MRAQPIDVDIAENVFAVEENLPFRTLPRVKVLHAVQDPKQRGLAAAGGPTKAVTRRS